MKLYAILLLVPFCFGGIIHPEDSSQDETSPEYDNGAFEDENSSEYENRTVKHNLNFFYCIYKHFVCL